MMDMEVMMRDVEEWIEEEIREIEEEWMVEERKLWLREREGDY
ncbi:MAG: hypothetical protein PHT97_10880 [Methanoculleus sp.]|nr:hypothetical protein [Methanoculleus sp.]MDD4471645.1 hypothetical protein [Methanoculleus sp.]